MHVIKCRQASNLDCFPRQNPLLGTSPGTSGWIDCIVSWSGNRQERPLINFLVSNKARDSTIGQKDLGLPDTPAISQNCCSTAPRGSAICVYSTLHGLFDGVLWSKKTTQNEDTVGQSQSASAGETANDANDQVMKPGLPNQLQKYAERDPVAPTHIWRAFLQNARGSIKNEASPQH